MAIFNVMSAPYNAKNDGVTDDTAAINAALAAASASFTPAGGGEVYFPAGRGYRTTAALTPGSYTTLRGDSPSSVILADFNGDTIFVNALIGCTVRDMALSPKKIGGKTSGAEIRVDNSLNTTIRNITVGGGAFNGIALNGGANDYWHFLEHVIVVSASNRGLIIGASGSQWVQGVQAVSCTFGGAQAGVTLLNLSGASFHLCDTNGGAIGWETFPGVGQRVTALTLVDCAADSHSSVGFHWRDNGGSDISQVLMDSCWSATNHDMGVIIGPKVNGMQISNTQVLGNGQHGAIVVEGAKSILFTGCQFKSNGTAAYNTWYGLFINNGCRDILVSGCQAGAYGPLGNGQAFGFGVLAGTTNVSLIGNQAAGNVSGGYNVTGLAANVGNI